MSHHYRENLIKTNRFKRDASRCVNRSGKDGCTKTDLIDLMKQIMDCDRIDDKYKPHRLTSQYGQAWEAHLNDDCLMLWHYEDEETVRFVRIGSHEELKL